MKVKLFGVAAGLLVVSSVYIAGSASADPGAVDTPLAISIHTDLGRYFISPFIYGQNTYPGYQPLPECTAWRMGGNRYSTYNWETNSSGSGSDTNPESQSDWLIDNPQFKDVPAGVAQQYMGRGPGFSHNAALVVTIPFLGWVSADKSGTLLATDTAPGPRWKRMLAAKPGAPETLTAHPDGIGDAVYADEYAYALGKIYGPDIWTAQLQRIIFELDNEVDYWNQKHPLVHPKPATYAEINQKAVEWGKAIKDVAPNAIIFSPAGIGPLTMQSLGNAPDAPAQSKQVKNDYFISFLRAARVAQANYGHRVIDGFSFHWYAFGVNMTPDNRVQATRSLWDPTYTEDSWVSQWCSIWPPDGKEHPLELLPIMQKNISDIYPGTKLAITEYDYGGDDDITGAIAESDFLGIMGRQHVFLANHWGTRAKFIRAGIDIYRDFDGNGGTFGDVGLPVDGVPSDQAAVYAALDSKSKNHLTIVAINRTKMEVPTQISLVGNSRFTTAKVYQVTGAASGIVQVAPINVERERIAYTMPPLSVSLLNVR